ncbi:MAG: molybdopterin-guanine dinucleotide biosynthesis protein B [Candidatus Omnitrophica bacterium]|nr:molybdopterin-guanine dinucleotide biosynthesis protein B [Candidatus Omnitrophota bacterium]
MAVIIGVRGPSGSGKTTLIERLIRRLKQRGFSVGVVKHAHDGFQLDRRGKDSWRMWEAGAQVVVAAAPQELFLRQRHPAASLRAALALLPKTLDCIFVEGFARSRQAEKPVVQAVVDVRPTQNLAALEAAVVNLLTRRRSRKR